LNIIFERRIGEIEIKYVRERKDKNEFENKIIFFKNKFYKL